MHVDNNFAKYNKSKTIMIDEVFNIKMNTKRNKISFVNIFTTSQNICLTSVPIINYF